MTVDRRDLRCSLARLAGVRPWLFCGVVGVLVGVSGCAMPWERKALLGGRDTTIDNVQGPTERRLRDVLWRKEREELVDSNGSLKPIAGTEQYLAAEELYQAEDYEAAEKAFKNVAKKYKKSEIREDAIFMQAEAAYNQGHYADAEIKYSELLKFYPSTRHLDDVSKRLFEIARIWLDFPEAADLGEVQQVNYDDFRKKLPAENPAEKKAKGPAFWPNFTDESRPLFDPEGNGVGALRLIWLNDPTGPLADDALMLAASHYARKGDFVEADRHYTLLREEYPNSPHVQQAFVLGSHVKLMSYQGPNYDGKTLEDSEQLKESILRLYPDLDDKERIQRELSRMEEAKAAREWELVVLYERKNNPRAQAVYCHLLIERYPNTSFAKLARQRLQDLGPEYASGGKLLDPNPDPKRQSTFGRLPPKAPPPSRPEEVPAPRSLNPFRRNPAEPQPTPDDPDAKPIEKPAEPRRSVWPRRTPENAAPPLSPGEMEPPQEAAYSEEEAKPADEPGGWSRMLRFTPPRLLRPNSDAKPTESQSSEEPAAEEPVAEEPAGAAKL
jgi:TolA-binding protein